MFENVIHQGATGDISRSIAAGDLPNALLFWGEKASGKLTAALELARVLSCIKNASWDCRCPSCLRHKQLVSQDILLAGYRDCVTEILAAKKSFLDAFAEGAAYLQAACYFFTRSVRKLTMRFNSALVKGSEASKIADIVSGIDESLELIDPADFDAAAADGSRKIGDGGKLQKLADSIADSCKKLSSDFMYTSLPIAQVREISTWARFTVQSGKKTVVIENAETMLEDARNALLKILEEPPENIVFVLTTTNRQMMMPTILSRVRTCRFASRTRDEQLDVLKRVFHVTPDGSRGEGNAISAYLNSFLPANPAEVERLGSEFLVAALSGAPLDAKKIAAAANNFSPIQLFDSFFWGILSELKRITRAQERGAGHERALNFSSACMQKIREAKTRVTLTNQNAANVLEILRREIFSLAF
jgi:DNA polymerase-3 subunit gamma/tau